MKPFLCWTDLVTKNFKCNSSFRPMQVRFSVGDNDTHHRSAIFQHNMDTSGSPHNRSSLGSMMPTTTLSDPPLPESVIPLFGSQGHVQPATLILHSNTPDIAAPAQQMTDRQPEQPKQAYFTHLLPAGLTCHQRASFIRSVSQVVNWTDSPCRCGHHSDGGH